MKISPLNLKEIEKFLYFRKKKKKKKRMQRTLKSTLSIIVRSFVLK